ncbi:MAG: MFS transporter [Acidobacteria bacterium]|nr:MFS transporter [Acidobacteriota bacterium]
MQNPRSTYAAVLVLFAVNVLNFYDRNIAGALVEPMRKEFGLTDTQVGLLGSAFIWIYAIVGVPFGRIADRWSRKKLLVAGVLIWTSLTAFAGLASSYMMLLMSRLGVGVGEAVCAPTGTSWLGDLFPPDKRARVLAIFMLGVPIGGALSYFISGPAAQAWGWRTAMVIASLPALVLVPALLTLKEPQRGASENQPVPEAVAPAAENPVMAVLSIPTLWWIIASGVFLNFNMYAIGTFMPALLSRVHKLSLATSGTATGVTYIVGGLCGSLIAGYFGDRIIRTRANGRLVIAAALSIVGAPLAYFGVVQPAGNVALTLVCLTAAYATMNTYYGLVYSSIQDIVAPTQRGLTMALYFMAMYLCGASFGPLLTGSISDRMARQAMAEAGAAQMTEAFKAIGLQQAMVIIPVLAVALALVLWLASRTFVKDVAKRDRALAAVAGSASVG